MLQVKGDIRLISSYILEEISYNLSPVTLDILLTTSVLNRFNAEIIEVINQEDKKEKIDGEAFISKLAHDNLFLIPLDYDNNWYTMS